MLTGGAIKPEARGSSAAVNFAQYRWDTLFGLEPLHAQTLARIMSMPVFSRISAADFPNDLPLCDIICNDGRVLRFDSGDVVSDEADYGHSLFIVLSGHVRIVAGADETDAWLTDTGSMFWSRLRTTLDALASKRANDYSAHPDAMMARLEPHIDGDVSQHEVPPQALGPNEIFGVLSAMRRSRRGETVVACEDDTQVLELRWPGVRDLRFWSAEFRDHMDELYLSKRRRSSVRRCELFGSADEALVDSITESSMIETHGQMAWSHGYRRRSDNRANDVDVTRPEPLIAEQGEYLRDILIVGSGIVRASYRLGCADLTAGFLMAGDILGPNGEITGLKGLDGFQADYRLTACGYADIVRVPLPVVAYAQHVTSNAPARHRNSPVRGANLTPALRDFIVDHRFANGTSAMVINLDRCVNCNDCVRACAATHDGMARFERRGKVHRNFVVAQACMHCRDPVCLIDCPTDAIHRLADNGHVVIDDAACIGCSACANACPYGSIRMENVHDAAVGPAKAVKCDHCAGQSGGPACKRACPHDAIERVDLADAEALPHWIRAI